MAADFRSDTEPRAGPLDPAVRAKLLAVIAQMDASEEGVIVAAALAAKRLLTAHGLTWRAIAPILLPAPEGITRAPPPTDWRSKVRECSARLDLLTAKEQDFISNARSLSRLTPKQEAWLAVIVAKVRAR
jgi:hypothetical protein